MKNAHKIPAQIAWRRIEDTVIILDLDSSAYYSLNAVGARMWELLIKELAPDEVIARITAEYDAPPERVRGDLMSFLKSLRGKKLLEAS